MARNIEDVSKFIKLLNAFRMIERVVLVNGTDRYENDVEHSYHLAMLAWYIVSSEKLSLDLTLVLKYAMAQDLVEIYAGDTYVFTKDTALLESKAAREEAARQRLIAELPEFPELHEIVEKYEKREDLESRFVYALDKLQPMLQIYTDGGRTWKKENISLEELVHNKESKVALSPEVQKYFNELKAILEAKKTTFFENNG